MQEIEKNIPRAAFISREKLRERQGKFRSAWMRAAQKRGMEHFIIEQIDGTDTGKNVIARGLKELLSKKNYLGLYRSFLEEIGAGRFWPEKAGVPEAFLWERNPEPACISYAGSGAGEKWRYDQIIPAGLIDVLLLSENYGTAAEFTKAVVGNPRIHEDEMAFWNVMKCLLELTPEYPEITSGIVTASRGENGSSRLLVEFIPAGKTLDILEKMREGMDDERERFESRDMAILAVGFLRSRVNKELEERRLADEKAGAAPAEASAERRAIMDFGGLGEPETAPAAEGPSRRALNAGDED